MRRHRNRRPIALVALMCLAALAHAQGTLERNRPSIKNDVVGMTYSMVWGADEGFGPYTPVRIEIDNPLKDDRGVVTVESYGYRTQYPVELPAKSLRSFIAYIPSGDYQKPTITLDCRQAHLKAELNQLGINYSGSLSVGLVSDSTSLLTFVRTLKTKVKGGYYENQEVSVQDYASLPQYAPDRAIGYEGLDAVVLGEGAERLTDEQVSAIQRYVLSGGSVLMTGGAVSPVTKDPRWASFLPGRPVGVVNMNGSSVLSKVCGVRLSGTVSLMRIDPDPGTTGLAEQGVPILWYRRCGLGMCIYWAFDPFQSPVRTYVGRSKLFLDTMSHVDKMGEQYITQVGAGSTSNAYDYWRSGSYSSPGYPPLGDSQSVFNVSTPSTGTVFLILAAYFVVVVPLNFLVLARLGKGHLAWVTSPLIGIAFASIFFYTARQLYSAGLTRSTTALIVAHQGAPAAFATGRQQLFFPRGGRYDLKFSGVEAVGAFRDMYSAFRNDEDNSLREDLVDVGQVIAPEASVGSLTFREIGFQQSVPWPYKTPIRLKVLKDGTFLRAQGVFTNDTPYTISNATLWAGTSSIQLGSVSAGQTVDIDGILTQRPNSPVGEVDVPVSKGQVVLVADVSDVKVGANLGKEERHQRRLYLSFSTASSEVARK
ncbi:MAG TPA: hypothetical protein VNI20_02320 [Fimbriimonadaceae bacterium]|nr:hypothetical protein [Fimbriimonadaceae bacterium]